jgi:flagellar L-ring protein precursor FlgH
VSNIRPRLSRLFCFALLLAPATACKPKAVSTSEAANALSAYVAEAKNPLNSEMHAEGSLWVDHSQRSDLVRDFRELNDSVTIRVVETTVASTSADAKTTKNSEMSTQIDSLFGLEKHIDELPNLVNGKSSSAFKGAGSTSRTSSLVTNVSARVVDVLPNGYLVVEGAREVRLNNENQTISITGVVRPVDINQNNVVLSSAISQMSVKVQGKGLVSQPLNPGWLFKILNGILPF